MQNLEVCGKFQTCRPRRIVTTLLPGVSFYEKDSVLEGSEICRILPSGDSGSAVKTEIGRPDLCFRLPRPAVLLQKIWLCSEVSDFPRTSEMMTSHRGPYQQWRHPRQHPIVVETSKGRCRKPNNDPSLSPPHVESTETASLGTSYRNVKQPNKAAIGNAAVRHQFLSK